MKKMWLMLMLWAVVLGFTSVPQASEKTAGALIDTAWLAANKDPNLVVLDVRKPQEMDKYLAGHIPGARFVAWDAVRREKTIGKLKLSYAMPSPRQFEEIAQAAGITKNSFVVVSSDWSSVSNATLATRLYLTLQYYGVDSAVLNGGTTKWIAENKPLEKEAPKVKKSKFKAKVSQPSLILTATDVEKAMMNDKNLLLLDGRAPEFYRGEKKKDYVAALGHIPGAVNVNGSVILDKNTGMLKDAETLKKIFADAGVTPDKRIIAYCDSGHLSTGAWFVLTKVLGYKQVQMFDNSLHEWTMDPKRPMKLDK